MNRRTFLSGATAALALTPLAHRASAQSTPATTQARWDDTSFLFGNAFDLLPAAPEGEAGLVRLVRSSEASSFGMTSLVGLIHNNTDADLVLVAVETEDGGAQPMFVTMQSTIASHAYALFGISVTMEIEPGGPVPNLVTRFVEPGEVMTTMGYDIATIPLTIDHAELTDASLSIGLINASETDLPESLLSGMIVWFDNEGQVTDGVALGELAALPAGERREGENFLFADYNPAQPYLVGYYGFPD